MKHSYIEVDWHLTNRCNFYCDYCHPQIRRVLNRRYLNEPSVSDCVEAFTRLGRPCHILMSGGEPFLFPDFLNLCKALSQKHIISINTNLAHDTVSDFAKIVPTTSVRRIAAAVHIKERERISSSLERFADHFCVLREAGFNILALYVLHPSLLRRAEADFNKLRELGIDVLAGKVFKGIFESKRYPDAYSQDDRALIRRLTGEYHHNEAYLSGQYSFMGQRCTAGQHSIKVNINGDVNRCATLKHPLGNLFDGTFRGLESDEPCTARRILVMSQCLSYLTESNAPKQYGSLNIVNGEESV